MHAVIEGAEKKRIDDVLPRERRTGDDAAFDSGFGPVWRNYGAKYV